MNSLEFINQEIEDAKHEIKMNEIRIENMYNKTFYEERTEVLNNKLQTLQQIKTELEAWEVVKHLIYKRKMGEERFIQVMGGVYNEGQCWTSGINPYEIIKKALEVKE